jgi:hypothetical protein
MNNSTSLTKKERIQKFGEVFTSVETVNQMLDMLPPETFKPERTFLEPCCGEGVFIIEILKRKFANCKKRKDYTTSLKSVYGMELQADNVEKCIQNILNLCGEYFKVTKTEEMIVNEHIMQADSLKVMNMINERSLSDDEH